MRWTLILFAALAPMAAKCDDESSSKPKETIWCEQGEDSPHFEECEEAGQFCLDELEIDAVLGDPAYCEHAAEEWADPEWQEFIDFCECFLDEGFTHEHCETCLDLAN